MVHRFASGRQLNVGVVGATGVVGSAMLAILKERDFPIGQLRLFASARSAGRVSIAVRGCWWAQPSRWG